MTAAAQAAGTSVSLVSNFTINNLLTYADRQLRGWRWLAGLASFALICGIGALANVGLASWLFNRKVLWSTAALAGLEPAVSTVYARSLTCPSGAVQRAVVVMAPVRRSIDWRHLLVCPALSKNSRPPSEKMSADQAGMLARCWTSPGG